MDQELAQFLDHMERLSKECQRREDVDKRELVVDICNRLKYGTDALKEIRSSNSKRRNFV